MNDSLTANKAIFILLAIFIFRFGVLGGASSLHDVSSLIFKIEILLILLYTLANRKLPDRSIIGNPLLIFGILTWVTMILVRYVVGGYTDIFANEGPTFYLAFHGVFAIYAIAIIREIRIAEAAGQAVFFSDEQTRDRIMFMLLCVLTFGLALASGENAFGNAVLAYKFELSFIIAYVFVYKSGEKLPRLFNDHRTASILMIAWFIVVTLSLLFSPLDLIQNKLAITRYQQTFFHVLFFVFVYLFFLQLNRKSSQLFLMVPLSVVVLAIVFVTARFIGGEYDYNWFHQPPLNSHIRHTGYIVTASAVVAFTLLLHDSKAGYHSVLYLLLALISATLLFWTGGRAASGSLIITLIFVISYLAYVRALHFNRLVATILTLSLAVYLSELFNVFEWNGLFSQISRTEAAEGAAGLTTHRSLIWAGVIESLEGHWLLGFGPQGYLFAPSRYHGTMQPHSMFVQFLVEWGLVGAGLFLAMLIRAAVFVISSIKNNNDVASAGFLSSIAVIVALSIHGVVDGTYYHGQPSYYLALSYAICLGLIIGKRHLRPTQPA